MKDEGVMAEKVINLVIDLTKDGRTDRPRYWSASHLKSWWIPISCIERVTLRHSCVAVLLKSVLSEEGLKLENIVKKSFKMLLNILKRNKWQSCNIEEGF